MRLRPFIGALALCVFAAPGAQALEPYTWRDRVVLVFAASADAAVTEQRNHTKAAEEALAERDMSVIAVVGSDKVEHWFGQERGQGDAAAIRTRFKVPADQAFLVLLIGKDGEVKWRTEKPTDLEDAIALVDAMPMRQRESGSGG